MSTTATDKPYTIVSEVHVNQWDAPTQTVIPGWKVTARWTSTGTTIPVFVADTFDLVSTADTLIRFQGAQIDALRGK